MILFRVPDEGTSASEIIVVVSEVDAVVVVSVVDFVVIVVVVSVMW